MISQRVLEAKKLGFDICVVPKVCSLELQNIDGIKIVYVSNVSDVVSLELDLDK